jgi:hypothetical protein
VSTWFLARTGATASSPPSDSGSVLGSCFPGIFWPNPSMHVSSPSMVLFLPLLLLLPGAAEAKPSTLAQPMIRLQNNIRKLICTRYTNGVVRYGLCMSLTEPSTLQYALASDNWRAAMDDDIAPCSSICNLCKWLYKLRRMYCSIDRACLVSKSQRDLILSLWLNQVRFV